MAERVAEWNTAALQANLEALGNNSYPGRFIGLGVSESGDHAVQVYAVMGRSDPSRNRVLVAEPDVVPGNELVKTDVFDEKKLGDNADLSLIIYNAMRTTNAGPDREIVHVVSNGHQTDNVVRELRLASAQSLRPPYREIKPVFTKALTTDTFVPDEPKGTNKTSYEPDSEHTSRITAYTARHEPGLFQYGWAITRRDKLTEMPVHTFGAGPLDQVPDGAALAFHTYDGDGKPLPPFTGNPYPIKLEGNSPFETAEALWEDRIDKDNRVAMAVKYIHRISGLVEVKIINQLQPEVANDLIKQSMLIEAMLDDIMPIDEVKSFVEHRNVKRDRHALAKRSGWTTMPIEALETVYRGDRNRKLPYAAV